MSKRQCISLLHAHLHPTPHQSRRCIPHAITNTTLRGDNHPSHPSRPFSTTSSLLSAATRQVSRRSTPQPSVGLQTTSQLAAAQAAGTFLDHAGLLPGTFIPPTGRNRPSFFTSPRDCLALEYQRFINNVFKFAQSYLAAWTIQPRPKLERFQAPQIAKQLYEQMYKNFADGDVKPMEASGLLHSGIASSLRKRIQQWPAGQTLDWRIMKYHGRPKCVSYVFAKVPGSKDKAQQLGIAQAVIRIRSRQSLMKLQKTRRRDPHTGQMVLYQVTIDGDGYEVPQDLLEDARQRNSKDVTEYVVVQKIMKKSSFGRWHLWGMADETSMDQHRKNQKKLHEDLMRT